MKVAILGSRGIPASYGGFETFAEHVSIGFAERGVEVTVYCPSYQEYRDREYKGVRLQRIWCMDNKFKNRILRAINSLLYDIISIFHASFSRFDTIYMLGYSSGPFLLVPRLCGKVLIVNPDGLEWKSKRWGIGPRAWLRLCEWAAARLSSGLIADADAIRDHFVERFKVDAESIPYGADLPSPEYRPLPSLDCKGFYLAVARMVPETSIPMIIRGFLASGSARCLVVVGPVPDQLFFDTEVAPLIDGDRVRYLGPIYDRDLLVQYRVQAFCLLHGHASDGTNPSLLESMGCASPVIAIGTRSNANVLGMSDELYFSNCEDLAEAIQKLETKSPAEMLQIGEANRQTIGQRFGWDRCVERHLEAFAKFSKPR